MGKVVVIICYLNKDNFDRKLSCIRTLWLITTEANNGY